MKDQISILAKLFICFALPGRSLRLSGPSRSHPFSKNITFFFDSLFLFCRNSDFCDFTFKVFERIGHILVAMLQGFTLIK